MAGCQLFLFLVALAGITIWANPSVDPYVRFLNSTIRGWADLPTSKSNHSTLSPLLKRKRSFIEELTAPIFTTIPPLDEDEPTDTDGTTVNSVNDYETTEETTKLNAETYRTTKTGYTAYETRTTSAETQTDQQTSETYSTSTASTVHGDEYDIDDIATIDFNTLDYNTDDPVRIL